MYLIIQHKLAKDWIVATGTSKSVRDFCKLTFELLNLNYKDYVIHNKDYTRPEELNYLKGDSSETRKELKWKPNYTFEAIVDEMVKYWIDKIKKI